MCFGESLQEQRKEIILPYFTDVGGAEAEG